MLHGASRPTPMLHAAAERLLEHLRQNGTTQNADLLALLDGDAALFASARHHLVDTGQAADVGGIGLALATPPAAAPAPPAPDADDEKPYDLFVSYAHADDRDGFVSRLVERFVQAERAFDPVPPRVFFDRTGIGNADWEHRILEGLKHASAMLVVLSPNYFASDFCRREWNTFLERERRLYHSGIATKGLYVATVPDFDGSPETIADPWRQVLAYRQWTNLREAWRLGPAFFDTGEAPAFVELLRQECRTLIALGQRAGQSFSNVPDPGPHFTGRSAELRALRTRLLDTRVAGVVATQGLGGVGKSALAFAYAHQNAADYPGGRFLLRADLQTDLVALVGTLHTPMGLDLPPEVLSNPEALLARVHAALAQRGKALLVLDNVSEPSLVAPSALRRALPPDGVDVLLTSRLNEQDLTLLGTGQSDAPTPVFEVGPLAEVDALALLNRYRAFASDADHDAARQIVHCLGGYALALEVVAVYLWKHKTASYPDFAERLAREGFAGLETTGDFSKGHLKHHTEAHLSALLGPTLDGLTDAAQAVLNAAAVLPPDAVVWPWLRQMVARTASGLVPEAVPGYPDPWTTIQDTLHGLRLLAPADPEQHTPSRVSRMHRLVREVVRARLAPADLAALEDAAFAAMTEYATALNRGGWHDRGRRWELAPLATACDWFGSTNDVRTGALANGTALTYRELGFYAEARRLFEVATRIQRTHFDADHPNLAIIYSNLAVIVQAQGDLVEARRLLEESIRIERTHLDADHPNLATRYSNLAGVMQDMGEISESCRLFEESIRIWKKHPDANYPGLAFAYSSFAGVLHVQGNNAEARRLLNEAIRIELKHVVADHPNLAIRYSNLAVIVQAQGDLVEARRLYEEAIRIWQKYFDADHPNLAVAYSNLAGVLQAQGDLVEARRLLEESIRIERTHFDADHPNLAVRYSELGGVAYAQGDLVEARRLYEEAIRIERTHFDADHPNLAVRYSELAVIVQAQGDLVEARRLLEESIRIERTHFDADHPNFAFRYTGLGGVAYAQGDLVEARRLYEEAIRIELKHVVADHPNLAIIYSNLAVIVQAQGDLVEARRLLEESIRIERTHFDADHPNLAFRHSNLGDVLQAQGDLVEARRLYEEAIRIERTHFDADHPNFAFRYTGLGGVAYAQGDLVEARRLYEEAIRIGRKHFDADHPNLATAYSNLGLLLLQVGEHDEALRLLRTALAIFLFRLGQAHPKTQQLWQVLTQIDRAWAEEVAAGRIDLRDYLPTS